MFTIEQEMLMFTIEQESIFPDVDRIDSTMFKQQFLLVIVQPFSLTILRGSVKIKEIIFAPGTISSTTPDPESIATKPWDWM